MNRRQLLLGTGLVAGSLAVSGSSASASGWEAVRSQFRTDPKLINFAHFYLASHPRPVRARIEYFSRLLDENSYEAIHGTLSGDVAASIAGYIGGKGDDIAFVPNTTTGLGIAFAGLKLRPGQEIVVHEQDHYAMRQSAQLAADRAGAQLRTVSMFADSAKTTVDEMASRLRSDITPRTRAVGVTWVQSSTGVRTPLRELAAVVAEANRGRAEQDRCLLVVDGVHGLAAVNDDPALTGVDVFVAGTHKWLFGPRGTGIIWVKPDAIQHFVPTVPSFDPRTPTSNLGPGGFVAYEHLFALPEAVNFHQRLGRAKVAARISELQTQVKDGLAKIPGVTMHTPADPAVSAGVACFDFGRLPRDEVVKRLGAKGIQITVAPYATQHLRIGTSILNTPEEIDKVLKALVSV
ncbi:aminotransferase class V-fold PLP-dependent enzyme [Kibdelosporangium aridum]|uniref:Aminotransferase class V-fold PLP-dependent enzyme n=1 Tax=Kibdelosporangium aridum TaxID=2030 RepID=A0A428YYG2_KIBAR|nr:aminotransferase class V-fold PLP-dependent enzyme [Kibdelosporangium aridum]RSM75373.1 aminotransferase class V-fold PLP-dependent enzyme [Kibdelosporangium aridum]